MMSSSWLILAITFLATVMLVLALCPVFIPRQPNKNLPVQSAPVSILDERRSKWLCGLLAGAVTLCLLLLMNLEIWVTAVLTIAVAFFSAFIIGNFSAHRRKKRNALFELRMLDFLILVNNHLRSGFALPKSIETSARSIGGPLEAEFNFMLSEYRLGIDLSEAIRRMTQRVQSENLQLFAATITISLQTGSSISSVLDRLIATIRKRNEMTDKLKAAVAQFRFEAFVMSFFPYIAFAILYYLDPKMMSPMLTTQIGWVTIAGVTLLEIIGLQILKKLCKIKM